MKCPRCLNEDPSYFYYGSKGWYCRKCISFSRICLEESNEPISLQVPKEESEEYILKYPLTAEQKKISRECAHAIQTTDVLIHAVCGAGKTELVIETIAMFLKMKKKICFAIARRQVVLELQERLQAIFPKADVVAICGGHTNKLDGDLIVCTTHQLYRFYHAFDCLILDEPDAYPFNGNSTLHGIAKTSCKGHCVYLTATPDDFLLKKVQENKITYLTLNKRPHGKDLPVPKLKKGNLILQIIYLCSWINTFNKKPRMIFVPTIRQGLQLHFFLSLFFKTYFCTSKTKNRDEVIEKFRKDKAGLCICTTVLERGVTIPNVNICVFHADHDIFNLASLIQMAGRAGRNINYPYGDVLFITDTKDEKVQKCIKEIERANRS